MHSHVYAFANGTDYEIWESRNCERCIKGARYDELDYRCKIQEGLGVSYLNDGTVSTKTADIIGISDGSLVCKNLVPEDGTLVEGTKHFERQHKKDEEKLAKWIGSGK